MHESIAYESTCMSAEHQSCTTIYGYVHACKHCKPWVNSDACQFCIAHQPSTWHGQSHVYMSTCMQTCTVFVHVSNTCGLRLSTIKIAKSAMSTIASIHMCTRQCQVVTSVYTYTRLHETTRQLYVCTCHKRPCECVAYMSDVSVYVLSTFTKLCDQKAQWVSTIASTDTYMQVRISTCMSADLQIASLKTFTSIYGYVCMQALKAMSRDKYMHVSLRPHQCLCCVYM